MIDIGNRICAVALLPQLSVPVRPQLPRRSTETGAWWPRPPRAIVEACSSPSQLIGADSIPAVDITSLITRRSWMAASRHPDMCRRTGWLARAPPMPSDVSGSFRAAGLGAPSGPSGVCPGVWNAAPYWSPPMARVDVGAQCNIPTQGDTKYAQHILCRSWPVTRFARLYSVATESVVESSAAHWPDRPHTPRHMFV